MPIYMAPSRRYSSYRGEMSPAPGNLVGRRFHAQAPNRLWVTDIFQFNVDGRKCWLSVIVDCFDGMVVDWKLGDRPDQELANSNLRDAAATLGDGEHPVVHSDRGSHYRWPGWIRIMDRHGLTRSMSAKGCSPDNAAAEGFFGRCKNEMFHKRDWAGVGLDQFRERMADYMHHYNHTRIKQSLGWLSPVEYRQQLGLTA